MDTGPGGTSETGAMRPCELDAAALRRRLDEDGYAWLPGLLPREPVAALRRALLGEALAGGWIRGDRPLDEAVTVAEKACIDPEPEFLAVFRRMYRLEELHALHHEPRLGALLAALLGGPVLPHPRIIARCIFPASQRPEGRTTAHQDFVHVQGALETYSVWIPIGDCPRAHGGLEVAVGSHRRGILDSKLAAGPGGMEVADPLTGSWASADYRLGDVVVFHSLTVHRALPNRTDRLRLSCDTRFQRVDQPIEGASLKPYADLFDWDAIYAGWRSTALQRYWERHALDVVGFDRRWYDKRDADAFAIGERGDPAALPTLRRIVQRDTDAAKVARAERLIARLERAGTPA